MALLFVLYELFGVITHLVGGWLGARVGLNRTMNIGLALQVVALAMLLVPADALTVAWVMAAQALSGGLYPSIGFCHALHTTLARSG